jgi:hypothetical protein
LGTILLHENELPVSGERYDGIRERYGDDVTFEITISPSSGEIFTRFYDLHVRKPGGKADV